MSEAISYLENYWVPAVGSSVVFENEIYRINSFVSEDSSQVLLEKNGNVCSFVCFVQDLSWFPVEDDLDKIFLRLGFKDCGDSWYLDRVFYPKTADVDTAYKSVMQARARRLELPEKDLAFL